MKYGSLLSEVAIFCCCESATVCENAAYPEPGGAKGRPRVPGEAGQEQRGHQEVPGAGQE